MILYEIAAERENETRIRRQRRMADQGQPTPTMNRVTLNMVDHTFQDLQGLNRFEGGQSRRHRSHVILVEVRTESNRTGRKPDIHLAHWEQPLLLRRHLLGALM